MELMNVAGRKVVLCGWNKSAETLLPYLKSQGAQLCLFDARDGETLQNVLSQSNIDLSQIAIEAGELSQRTLQEVEMLVLTPGVRLASDLVASLRERGVQIVSELELVSSLVRIPYVCVTGTNGKTTTTKLLAHMLEAQGRRVFDNADKPLANLLTESVPEFAIVRATSDQLAYTNNFKAAVNVLLNIYPESPDHYQSVDEISADYQQAFRMADSETLTILNANDARIAMFYQQIPGRKLYMAKNELPEVWEGAWCDRNGLNIRSTLGQTPDVFALDNLRLRGEHNRENLMAATLAAITLNVGREAIEKTIEDVRAPQHRVKFIKRFNSVAFYDDSACSNVDALVKTLHAFQEPIILIAGGKDNGADYSPLVSHIRQKVKNLILVGEAKESINRMIGDYTETFLVGTMEEAVMMAYQKSRSGDVVLLSPSTPESREIEATATMGNQYIELIDQLTRQRNRSVFF